LSTARILTRTSNRKPSSSRPQSLRASNLGKPISPEAKAARGTIRKRLRKILIAVHAAGVDDADGVVVAAIMLTRYPDKALRKAFRSQKMTKMVAVSVRVAAPRRLCYPVSLSQNIGIRRLVSKAAGRLFPRVNHSPSNYPDQARNLHLSPTASVLG
jgi:hypothetical protein